MKKRKKYTKKSIKKKVIITSIILILLWIFAFYLYITYQNIEVTPNNYETMRTKSTIEEQTVESEEEKSQTIADMLEETTRKVVGISKLKNTGSSIFSSNSENDLGLGTGVIVSNDGYILSNEHVTGAKYSKCYVTLENGNTYDGTVMWSDSSIDLSITKINAKKLEAVTLGNSEDVRVGENKNRRKRPILIYDRFNSNRCNNKSRK